MFRKRNIIWIIFFTFCISCSEAEQEINPKLEKEDVSLKNAFENDFLTGVAIREKHYISTTDIVQDALIKKEFNSITAENDMKWRIIHPNEDTFSFAKSDAFVAFGEQNNMDIIGHTLIWHSNLPSWVKEVTCKGDLKKIIQTHIQTIVGRYKGKVKTWDVVNEALNRDGSPRNSQFYEAFNNESYINLAFKTAAKADPDAKLIYNDFSLSIPSKRNGAIRIIKNLQKNGIRIDGVGIQAHYSLNWPTIQRVEEAIIEFSKLGIKVSFTELDINVLPDPPRLTGANVNQNYEQYEGDSTYDPYTSGLPTNVQEQLAQRYSDFFNLFVKHKDKIDRVTFWGVNDGNSWLNNWPIKGRTNYPLLFDRNNLRKRAYNDVISIKE